MSLIGMFFNLNWFLAIALIITTAMVLYLIFIAPITLSLPGGLKITGFLIFLTILSWIVYFIRSFVESLWITQNGKYIIIASILILIALVIFAGPSRVVSGIRQAKPPIEALGIIGTATSKVIMRRRKRRKR